MAVNKIKGLTVEIGGDTTKLGKALEGINKKSRDLSSELGEINRMLKFDPGNADLLAQKQKVLAEAVDNTSEKLEILREAEKQVQKQFEKGEVSEDQYRALQREVMDTERKLGTYEKAAKETAEAVDNLADDTKNVTDDTKKMSKEADNAGDSVLDLSHMLKEAGDAGETMGKKLANAAKTGLKVVAAGAAAAAAGVGAATKGLAESTVSAANYADEMLTMSSVTGVSTDDLQAFSYAAELVDVDVETLTKSMAKNIKSMKGAADGSKLYSDAYATLGVSVTDANGNMRDSETVYWEAIDALGKMTNETERDAIAMQLFGRSAQELNPMIEAGAGKMKELTQEARDVGAVMSEDTLSALGSFDDSMQRLKGSAGAAKNSLGSVLLPELQMVTDTGTGLLIDFTKGLNESGGGLEGFAATAAAMAPEIASKVSDLVTQLLDKVTSLAPVIINVAMSLLTGLVTSLISMLPQLIETGIQIVLALVDGIAQAIPQIVQAVVDMVPRLVQALVEGIPLLIQGAVQLLMAIVDAIPQIIPPIIEALPQIILAIINGLLGAIPQLIQGALQFLMAIVKAIPLLIKTLVPLIPDIVMAIVNTLLDNLPVLLDAAVQLFFALVKAIPVIILELVKALPKIITTIVSVLGQIPGKIWEILKGVFTKIGQWGAGMATKAREACSKFLSNVVNFFKQLPGKIWSWLSNAAQKVANWGTALVAKGRAAVKKLVDAIVNKVKELPGKMKTAGKNLVEGLWSGISNAYNWLKNKIKGWVGNVMDFIKRLFGINSPSKKTEWMGEMLDEGFAVGIEGAADSPLNAMSRLSKGMLDEADSLNGVTLERRINSAFSAPAAPGMGDGMLDKLDKILAAIERGQVLTIDGKALIGRTVGDYDTAMGQRRALAARGAL